MHTQNYSDLQDCNIFNIIANLDMTYFNFITATKILQYIQ